MQSLPIQSLMDEHRRIERVMDGLVAYGEAVRAGETDPETERAELEHFATFLRDYADRHHHGREEDILFELMTSIGFPREQGPIAIMLREHVEGRAYVSELFELAAADAPWDEGARRKVVLAAGGFVNLLRSHIMKEDQVLYPMAMQALTPPMQDELRGAFAAHEAEHGARAKELVRLGEELASRWLDTQTGD